MGDYEGRTILHVILPKGKSSVGLNMTRIKAMVYFYLLFSVCILFSHTLPDCVGDAQALQ